MTRNIPKQEDQLARFGQELRDGHWLGNAQQRARRRKSAWNLLLPLFSLPLWLGGCAFLGWSAARLRTLLHPAAPRLFGNGPLDIHTALVLFPSLMGSICPALFLTNVLVYLIPAARRAMDAEDRNWPGSGYAASQNGLLRAGLWVGAICLPVILLGVVLA